jgi:hypothetical protein
LSKDDYDDEKHLARLYRTYGDNIDQMKQRIMELKTHSDVYAYGVDNVLGRAAELVFVQKVFEVSNKLSDASEQRVIAIFHFRRRAMLFFR